MIILKSPAKVNLYLHILGKVLSGKYKDYHLLDSLIYFDNNFYDEIYCEDSEELLCEITGAQAHLINTEDNLMIRAVKLLKQEAGIKKNIKLKLQKNIPIGAGLGGGSSNAATIMNFLNQHWQLNIAQADLMKLGECLGADIPVCILGQPAQISGIGEVIEPIALPFKLNLQYKYIEQELLTKKVYQQLTIQQNKKKLILPKFQDVDSLIGYLSANTTNDLQAPALEIMPEIQSSIDFLALLQPRLVRMTGSGNAVYSIYYTISIK